MDSLSDYTRRLETALKKKDAYVSYNRDMSHAKVVVSVAFRHAKNEILLLSNKLDPELYSSPMFIRFEVEPYLKKGGRLSVLVENDVPENHPIRELAQKYETVEIRRIPAGIVEAYEFNFMVIDDIGYRFENDRKEHQALVVLNDDTGTFAGMTERLKEIFSDLKAVSEPV